MRRIKVRVAERNDRDGYFAFWVDPLTGKKRSQKLDSTRLRDAIVEGTRLEDELNVSGGVTPGSHAWDEVVKAAKTQWLAHKSDKYRANMVVVTNHFERIIGHPTDMAAINATIVSRFQNALKKEMKSAASAHTYLKHFRTFLLWARRQGFVSSVPHFAFDRQGKDSMMRGRPIKKEEYAKIIAECDDPMIGRLITCMYLGGLRIGEAVALSWDAPPFRVDLSGKYPRFVIFSEGQKAGRDEIAPMTPDFADWLKGLPEPHAGLVCGCNLDKAWAGRLVAKTCRAAGVNATAHDLRRAFGTRWALESKPAVLQRLMRHSSIETTMKYYVQIDADDITELLYGKAS